jgi:regulator of protease activity HflC (stomatin/prohibitin superfamily)
MSREEDREFNSDIERLAKYCIAIIVCLVFAYMIISPIYNVWQQRLHGEAELARAEANRKIRVLEANAEEEAAKSLAQAEIIRARGVAEANKIIGDSLNANESYLRYLWIQNLKTSQKEVVYVPTEANLPILEANRTRQ